MSTALAIASVTHVIKDLLNNGLFDNDITGTLNGNVKVTSLPPDLVVTSVDEPAQLNLFLYYVTPNQGWRNELYPSHDSSGSRVSNPPLALNLHYLLTAYCSNELHTEILLGYGMQLLHENPVLLRDAIKKSLSPPSDVDGTGLPMQLQSLSSSKLEDQVELIKIIPEALNTEEISKLWTAFQSKYRPSAAYMASVVLIESSKSTKSALPVRARNLYVKPFNQPVINQVKSQSQEGQPILDKQKILQGYSIVLQGYNLNAENLKILVDGIEQAPGPEANDISYSQVIFELPGELPSGIHGIQVASQIMMGTPEVLHPGFESNTEVFILCPEIDPGSLQVANVQGSGNSSRSADISLTVAPEVGAEQKITLLLNQVDNLPGTAPAAYSFRTMLNLSPPGPSEDILIHISGVKAGKYLVRIRVDGAESPLETDVNGKYSSPFVIIP
jgi:hypothetical protein